MLMYILQLVFDPIGDIVQLCSHFKKVSVILLTLVQGKKLAIFVHLLVVPHFQKVDRAFFELPCMLSPTRNLTQDTVTV